MNTDYKGYILITIFFLANIGGIVWLFIAKKNLKECESKVSTNCPVYTCDTTQTSDKANVSSYQCGTLPYRCKDGTSNCTSDPKNIQCMVIPGTE